MGHDRRKIVTLMEPDLKAELLHLIAHERGATTKELFLAITVLRLPDNNLWPHVDPVDQPALQLLLFSLRAEGQIVLTPDKGWLMASAASGATQRKTFEEETQKVMW